MVFSSEEGLKVFVSIFQKSYKAMVTKTSQNNRFNELNNGSVVVIGVTVVVA